MMILIIIKCFRLNSMHFAREEWKKINLGEGFTNDIRIEVSNYGRIRSYTRLNNGKLLKGSTVNGYRIIRIKLFKPRDHQVTEHFRSLQAQSDVYSKKISSLKKMLLNTMPEPGQESSLQQQLNAETILLNEHKKAYQKLFRKDLLKRTTYWGGLIHRLVAENFLERGSEGQTIVAHIDHDKLNNVVANLQWMNLEENMLHQQSSPHVIADKEKRQQGNGTPQGGYKLTTTKVMFLKKLINEGKPLRNLAKQFKITETQVIRIMKQENWASVKAAE